MNLATKTAVQIKGVIIDDQTVLEIELPANLDVDSVTEQVSIFVLYIFCPLDYFLYSLSLLEI